MNKTQRLRLAIDIGGTFTDTVLMDRASCIVATVKTRTTAQTPALGALEGAQRVLQSAQAGWSQITGFIHGTRLATNALIERRAARVATVTNEGFRDILEIAYERRCSQYAINLAKPDLIVPRSRALTNGGRTDARGNELAPLDEEAVARLAGALKAAKLRLSPSACCTPTPILFTSFVFEPCLLGLCRIW